MSLQWSNYWNLGTAFSTISNPSLPFSYGSFTSGQFSLLDTHYYQGDTMAGWQNSARNLMIYQNKLPYPLCGIDVDQISLESDLGTPAVRFHVPYSSKVRGCYDYLLLFVVLILIVVIVIFFFLCPLRLPFALRLEEPIWLKMAV